MRRIPQRLLASFLLICLPIISFAEDNKVFYDKLVHNISQTVGAKEFPRINGQRYNPDCSGFVAFVFHLTGLNLLEIYGKGDSGVSAIWDGLEEFGLILEPKEKLLPGDIVFFDNTADINRNLFWDDKLSHIGMVESIDEYGTITYTHYGSKGVVRAKMNLSHPKEYSAMIDGEKYRLNDLLRVSKKRGINPKYLSGALYRGAARVNVAKK